MIRTPDHETDRGLSVALTHSLTIGITTVLIAMLLMTGGTMLDSERERSTEVALETVGERLAGEIDNVDRIANGSETADDVSLEVEHPRTITNSGYTVVLHETCSDDEAPLIDDSTSCLELASDGEDVTVYVPFETHEGIDPDATAEGGVIEVYLEDGAISIREADR
ncbi:DUF7266 family protein [Natronolimnohabitans innermongolicus]|uniref:Flagellin n=1 Tax=Natronolimnohabitans innermongolicus JCM 12255 TaxID=1227499 RepID=L9XG95_9EURY|nr:hypothetical protein C493_03592 [Natronolimnohabitans innermongolicus JCM 12255]